MWVTHPFHSRWPSVKGETDGSAKLDLLPWASWPTSMSALHGLCALKCTRAICSYLPMGPADLRLSPPCKRKTLQAGAAWQFSHSSQAPCPCRPLLRCPT